MDGNHLSIGGRCHPGPELHCLQAVHRAVHPHDDPVDGHAAHDPTPHSRQPTSLGTEGAGSGTIDPEECAVPGAILEGMERVTSTSTAAALVRRMLTIEGEPVVTITAPLDRRRPGNDEDRVRLTNLETDGRREGKEGERTGRTRGA